MGSVNLSSKRIVVSGAASGIGRATAQRVARDGGSVALVDRDGPKLQSAADEISAGGGRCRSWQADVRQEDQVEQALRSAAAWMGGIDVLLHLAGILEGPHVPIADFDQDVWDRVLEVNLRGTFLMAKHASTHMPTGGVMVLAASRAGVTSGSSSFAYGASKGGVHGLTMVLEAHLASRGIRVNDVCPGSIATPMKEGQLAESRRRTGNEKEFIAASRLLAPPEGVAEVFAFLASDAADYIRGSIFTR